MGELGLRSMSELGLRSVGKLGLRSMGELGLRSVGELEDSTMENGSLITVLLKLFILSFLCFAPTLALSTPAFLRVLRLMDNGSSDISIQGQREGERQFSWWGSCFTSIMTWVWPPELIGRGSCLLSPWRWRQAEHQIASCVSYFYKCSDKMTDKSHFRKEGFTLSRRSWEQFIVTEKAWWQEPEAAGPIASSKPGKIQDLSPWKSATHI